MDSEEQPPDDLRVRLTWPQPSSSKGSPFDPPEDSELRPESPGDVTPPVGIPAMPPRQPPAGRTARPSEPDDGDITPASRSRLGRWASNRRAAAQKAADAREQAARYAAERAAAERDAAKRAALERAAAKRDAPRSDAASRGDSGRGGAAETLPPEVLAPRPVPRDPRGDSGPASRGRELASPSSSPRVAAERARATGPRPNPIPARGQTPSTRPGRAELEAQRAAESERLAETQRMAQAAAERAAAERAQAQQAALERAEAQRAEAQRAAAERAAAEGAATRAQVDAAAERSAADKADSERAEAQRVETQRADAERAAAEAQRAQAERVAAEAAAKRAAAERTAQEAKARAERERVAAEQAAAQQAADERVAAEQAAAQQAADEKNAAGEEAAKAKQAAKTVEDHETEDRPLLTVDAENDDDDVEDDEDEHSAPPRTTVTTQELILAGRTDSLQAALASIALRIDALTSTTSTFRNLVSDRITDYAEQVGRMASSASNDLDDYRHLHERSIDQVRRSVGEAEDNIRRINRMVGDLDAKVAALITAIRDTGDAIDQMAADRDTLSDSLTRTLSRIEDGVTEFAEGRGATSLTRLGELVASLAAERERQNGLWTELQRVVVTLADDRERGADVIARMERGIADMTVGRERGLTKALAGLETRIDEIGSVLAGMSGEDLGGTLARLDSRLKELSTDLVVGRDRDLTRALAQLSNQMDDLAGLVTENRADLSPIEARLNRLARPTPVPPVDLSELHGRLDELAEAVAQRPAPDLSGIQTQLVRLAEIQAQTAPEPEPVQAVVAERIDQLGQILGEQLEGIRRRITLRARPSGLDLNEEAIAAIADAVAARLKGSGGPTAAPDPGERQPAPAAPPASPAPLAPGRPGRRPWQDT